MKFFIKKILLWPKDIKKKVRQIDFKVDKVNVVTGQSASGKSSIVWIIDYCLGASKCAIPVGYPIRDKTDWFGIHIQVDDNEILIARRNPGEKTASSEVFIQEGSLKSIPADISKNANTENLKNRINELCGLPSLSFIPRHEGSPIGFQARPSVRDMVSFCFQPQHIVANPFALFYRADTFEHRERLKVVFPLVLGAISNEHLFLRHELNELQSRLRRLEHQLDKYKQAADDWRSDVEGLMLQAIEYGLVKDQDTSNWNVDRFVATLRDIPTTIRNNPIPLIDEGASSFAVEQLESLRDREFAVASELGLRRTHLSKVTALSKSLETFESTANKNIARISSVGWFKDRVASNATCPLCGSSDDNVSHELQSLIGSVEEFAEVTSAIQNTPAVLDSELADTKKDISDLERQLNEIRVQRRELEDKNEYLSRRRQELTEIYRFVGRLEQSLVTLSISTADSDIATQINDLRGRILEIHSELDTESEQERLNDSLRRISANISRYTEILDLERSNDPVQLDINELTLRILSGNRRDYLWEVGSGKNYMGYHVSTLLALHLRFIDITNCPIPSFILFDQPSQVYFPEKWPEDADAEGSGSLSPEEIESYPEIGEVHRIFRAINDAVIRSGSHVQIIVTDHAGKITWEGLDEVHLVEEWRGDVDFLIPNSWLDDV